MRNVDEKQLETLMQEYANSFWRAHGMLFLFAYHIICAHAKYLV